MLSALISTPGAVFAGSVHDAICGGDLALVKRLLPNAAAINKEQDGDFPLSLAAYCYGGQPAIVEYLLDRGANVNVGKSGDYSPLMWAIRSMDNNPENRGRSSAGAVLSGSGCKASPERRG